MKATLRGIANSESFAASEEFAFLRATKPQNWSDLMALVQEVNDK